MLAHSYNHKMVVKTILYMYLFMSKLDTEKMTNAVALFSLKCMSAFLSSNWLICAKTSNYLTRKANKIHKPCELTSFFCRCTVCRIWYFLAFLLCHHRPWIWLKSLTEKQNQGWFLVETFYPWLLKPF